MAANRFDSLIDQWDVRLQRAFLQAVQDIKDQAQIEQIVRMLDKGDVEGALRAVNLDPALFRSWTSTIEQAFESGGTTTAAQIPARILEDGFRAKFVFDVRNPEAETWLRLNSSRAVTEIVDDQRHMIREVLRDGMSRGLNPRTVALDLVGRIGEGGKRVGGKIGLTSSQAEWVRNYADELVNDPAAALERTLRDKRFDGSVKRAIADGQPINADIRAKMVTAYENRALRYRAEAIARTEAMASLHAAQDIAVNGAIGTQAVAADTVGFIWRTVKPRGKNARETHTPMDGQKRAIGDPFITGAGVRLRYPGDPDGPPEEIVHCRCWREVRVDFLAGIK